MTISVRLSDKDTELIKAYSDMNNISLSDLIRNAVIEKIKKSAIIINVTRRKMSWNRRKIWTDTL